MATKDGWDIAVDIAQIASAIGTCGAVIFSLWLAMRANRPRIRVDLSPERVIFISAKPSHFRMVITNLAERNVVLDTVTWRCGQHGKAMPLAYEFCGDDQAKREMTWSQMPPGQPQAYQIEYSLSLRRIREAVGLIAGELPDARLRRLRIEIRYSTGQIMRIKLPPSMLDRLKELSTIQ